MSRYSDVKGFENVIQTNNEWDWARNRIHITDLFSSRRFCSISKEDNCPRDGLTVHMVTRYIMELARLIYESQYFIRVSSYIEKVRVLGNEDVQRRNIASVQRCNARPFRAARFMDCAERRVAKVGER